MTLEEAIKYYGHVADDCRRRADINRNDYMDLKDLAVEHEQLVDWLNELKVLRDKVQMLLEKQEQDSNKCCETCKYKNLPVSENPCDECYFASDYEDYYEAEEEL